MYETQEAKRKEKIETAIYILIFILFFAILFFVLKQANGQITIENTEKGTPEISAEKFKTNPLFSDVSEDPKKTGITQQQNDFTMLYGKLEYMQTQLDNLQNTCAQK